MISVFDMHTGQNDFNTCGLRILNPVSAYVTEELNGTYAYEISCPMVSDDDSWQYLQVNYIIKSSQGQLFQIYKVVTQTVNGVPTITAYANHIWYYLADMCVIFTEDSRAAFHAVNELFKPATRPLNRDKPFTGGPTLFSGGYGLTTYNFQWSVNLDGIKHYKFKHCSLAYALLGAPDSIVNLWGGYIHRDNFRFSINKDRKEGADDNAFDLIYGLNCTEVKCTFDISQQVTEHWSFDQFGHKSGRSYSPTEGGPIPHQKITVAEYSVDERWEYVIADDEDDCEVYNWEYLKENIDPKYTYEVNYVDSKGTSVEDSGWDSLRRLKVGDSGYVTSLDGRREQRTIISTKFNDVTERIDSLKLGKFIHSELHQNRWDKIIADDANASRRLDIVEKRMSYFELLKGDEQ